MPELELTYNFGVDSYEIGPGYGYVALKVKDLDATLERLAEQGIEPEPEPYRVREADRDRVSSETRMVGFER